MSRLHTTVSWMFLVFSLLAGFVLAGCSTEIEAPTAAATTDPETVAVGAAVRLDGSGSTDPQDLPLYYAWALADVPAGSQATLFTPEAATSYFVADVPGTYVAELIVSNGTKTSTKTTITVTAGPCGTYAPVVESIAAEPAAPAVGDAVSVSGVITDADIDAPCGLARTISRAWSLSQVPPGSKATLSGANLEEPFFVPDLEGDYTVTLTATDELGRTGTGTLTISVVHCSDNVPVVDAITPSSANPVVGQVVQFDAMVSDADTAAPCNLTETFTYTWTLTGQPAGSQATLNNAIAEAPSLKPDLEGDYEVTLVVRDTAGHMSTPVSATITAATCGGAAPTALVEELVPDLTGPAANVVGPDVGVNHIVQLSGVASNDPDNAPPCSLGQSLTYSWSFLALPAGSNAKLNNDTVENPSFTTDHAGTYVVGLVVTDSTGKSSTESTFTITADPSIGIGVPAGFTITTVATWPYIDGPRGLSKDGTGNIYVAEGNGSLMRILPDGTVGELTSGGFLANPVDVVFEATSNLLFVTGGGGVIAKVDLAGVQTGCVDDGASSFRGIDVFNGSGGLRILAGDQFGNRVSLYDPATCTFMSSNNFGGGSLDNPWGVTAALIGGSDVLFVTDASSDNVRRNTGGAYTTNTGTNALVSNHFTIGDPRDIVLTPCPTPKIIVANRDGANLLLMTNGTSVTPSVISAGYLTPVGLHFEDANNLLVTDETLDSVFRITGAFCSL